MDLRGRLSRAAPFGVLGPLKMGKSEEEAYARQKQKLEALTCRECTKAGPHKDPSPDEGVGRAHVHPHQPEVSLSFQGVAIAARLCFHRAAK
jgi:hypothetical protein